MLEVRAVLTLSASAERPYERKDDRGNVTFSMRSIQGSGSLFAGMAAQVPDQDDQAQVGVDVVPVTELNIPVFKNRDPKLFDAVASLRPGDRVSVWFTLDHVLNRESGRFGFRPGSAMSVEVLERAPALAATSQRSGFVDARPLGKAA